MSGRLRLFRVSTNYVRVCRHSLQSVNFSISKITDYRIEKRYVTSPYCQGCLTQKSSAGMSEEIHCRTLVEDGGHLEIKYGTSWGLRFEHCQFDFLRQPGGFVQYTVSETSICII